MDALCAARFGTRAVHDRLFILSARSESRRLHARFFEWRAFDSIPTSVRRHCRAKCDGLFRAGRRRVRRVFVYARNFCARGCGARAVCRWRGGAGGRGVWLGRVAFELCRRRSFHAHQQSMAAVLRAVSLAPRQRLAQRRPARVIFDFYRVDGIDVRAVFGAADAFLFGVPADCQTRRAQAEHFRARNRHDARFGRNESAGVFPVGGFSTLWQLFERRRRPHFYFFGGTDFVFSAVVTTSSPWRVGGGNYDGEYKLRFYRLGGFAVCRARRVRASQEFVRLVLDDLRVRVRTLDVWNDVIYRRRKYECADAVRALAHDSVCERESLSRAFQCDADVVARAARRVGRAVAAELARGMGQSRVRGVDRAVGI
ncbi:MAG: hypothetical protein HDKAJFGB_03272 [Anaerolineae bacterium]|nr:hypothetical protein [Anaerolineae bacterium]